MADMDAVFTGNRTLGFLRNNGSRIFCFLRLTGISLQIPDKQQRNQRKQIYHERQVPVYLCQIPSHRRCHNQRHIGDGRTVTKLLYPILPREIA